MTLLKIISLLIFSHNVLANQNEELIKLAVKNENIKNAFLHYNSSREEYYNSTEDKKKTLINKILKSKNCINSLIPNFESSKYRTLKERIDYRSENENAHELNGLLAERDVKGKVEAATTKDCTFKLNEQELKQSQAEHLKANSLIEENYKAMIDYKVNAHPSLKDMISKLEAQLELAVQLKGKLSPLEKKDMAFKFFSMTIKQLDEVSKSLYESNSECSTIYKTNFEKECAKAKKYTEIPGGNNRIMFCANDFKDKIKNECQQQLAIFN